MNTKTGNRRDPYTPDLFSAAATATAPSPPPKLPIRVFSVRLVRERSHLTEQISTPADAARLACELLEGYDREAFLVVGLSSSSRVVGAHIAHLGSIDASMACGREVYHFAILCNAKSIIVAHNHPSGNVEPSKADLLVTKQLKAAGDALSIQLLDSIVCGFDGRHTSLAERGLL
jgi:DNA repair protein RadC